MRWINLKYTKNFHYYGMGFSFDFIEFKDGKIYFWRKVEDRAILVSSITSNKRIKVDFVIDVSEDYRIVSFEFCNQIVTEKENVKK